METKLNLVKNENSMLEHQLENSEKQLDVLEKQQKKSQIEMDILRRQNEYKMFLADSTEQDKRVLEQEKLAITNELEDLRKINSIVETLAKVENKAQWANSIKKT